MTKPVLIPLPDRSRLVGLLTELSADKLPSAETNLAQRLGYLIGLSGPTTLANSLRALPNDVARGLSVDVQALQDDVLASREQMIKSIIASFVIDTDGPKIKVPNVCVGSRAEALLKFGPYQRFYTGLQVEMAVAADNLRERLRQGVSMVSPGLHQLAELDRTLDQSLQAQTRKLFEVAPKLLEQSFKELLIQHHRESENPSNEQPETWLMPGSWLERFYQKLRELVLAELDVRLQPVFGLLEALHEQTRSTT